MTSGMTCHHRLWTAHTIERRRPWHTIIDFGQHTRSYDVGRGKPSSPLGSTNGQTTSSMHSIIAFVQHRWSDGVGRGMQLSPWGSTSSNDLGRGMRSSPLGSTHGRTTSGVACHHRLWAAQTIERRLAWHVIIIFGKHTRSNDVGRGLPSSPLD